jgi:hypothetical protein
VQFDVKLLGQRTILAEMIYLCRDFKMYTKVANVSGVFKNISAIMINHQRNKVSISIVEILLDPLTE